MEIRIKGKNTDVSPTIKDYVTEKMSRLDRYFGNQVVSAEVELTEEKNPSIAQNQHIEVTLTTKGSLIRASESSIDMHASTDLVLDKLERQIKKHKEKFKDKMYGGFPGHRAESVRYEAPGAAEPLKTDEELTIEVRQMRFKPMTPTEAIMQMDTLGHRFFVFTNSETDEINVVYRRDDNKYGLIGPE
jgi:putative sigma-54 modulation protein